ncbi:MAG: hypothetical protein ACM37W_23575 [Actinomycetota bacterium]
MWRFDGYKQEAVVGSHSNGIVFLLMPVQISGFFSTSSASDVAMALNYG